MSRFSRSWLSAAPRRAAGRRLAAGAALALLAGCVNLAREMPPRRLYALEVPLPDRADAARAPGTILKVRAFEEVSRYRGRELLYRRSAVRYEPDPYNLLVVPPGALLAEAAGRWVARFGPFGRVVDAGSRVRGTHVLEGTVSVIEADCRNPAEPRAVLGLWLTLLSETGPSPDIVLQKHYSQSVPLIDAAPESLVEGWNRAAQAIFAAFEQDAAAALAAAPCREDSP